MNRFALDTNIILRFLLQDDLKQCNLIENLFQTALERGDRFWISSQVLLECLWVLESHYEVCRSDLLVCFHRLADSSIFELECAKALPVFQTLAQVKKPMGDLSDLLIVSMNASHGFRKTYTFDKRACKAAPGYFQLLSHESIPSLQ